MAKALKDAKLETGDIHYVNAHATATQWNDRNETAVVKQVFGEYAGRIPVVGTKAAHGHSIGASGALELISCVMSLKNQCVPPTINFHELDPDCDLDYVTSGSRTVKMANAMSNSFAFGGSNGSIIVGM
jgi:3-oxoacyl-(acyl-carrier-protein) synthase